MEIATIAGLLLALAGIVGGLILEGGSLAQILQPTAAMIVLGGTFGAVLVSFPLNTFMTAMLGFLKILKPPVSDPFAVIEQLAEFSTKARKEGIVSLEADAKNLKDEFLRKAIMMAVDGADPKEIQHTLETQLGYMNEHGMTIPKVWEAAGGYAPTVGIIGAVMGLIQVMQHLDNIEEVGHGIAVAFVATIYGVGCSNIIFLPAATKLTLQHKKDIVIKEMIIEGIVMVIEGVNPMVIRDKLSGFFVEKSKQVEAEKK
ncbi:MAG: flagellar motor protein [Deltaproteobacteria bacterium]|nr:flagellar motor protein [Deltaproteobacteria bacterium]